MAKIRIKNAGRIIAWLMRAIGMTLPLWNRNQGALA